MSVPSDPPLPAKPAPAASPTLASPLASFLDTYGSRLVLLAALILFAVHICPYWDADPDTVSYLSIARNLAAGKLQRLGVHPLYSPVYPAIISLAFPLAKTLGGTPFLYISIIHGFLSLLLVYGVRAWAAVYSARAATLIAILAAVNLGIWSMHRVARPEIAYIAATFWAGAALARAISHAYDRGDDESHSPAAPNLWVSKKFWWLILTAAILAALAAAIRPLPFVSIGAFFAFLYLAATRRVSWYRAFFATLLVASLSAASILTWMVADRHLAATDTFVAPQALGDRQAWTYIDFVKDWGSPLHNFAEGMRREVGEVGRLTIPAMRGAYAREGDFLGVNTFLYLPFFILLCIGWKRAATRTADPLIWMAPAYFLLFVLSKFDQGTRYLVPLVPIFFLCLWFLLQDKTWRLSAFTLLAIGHLMVSLGDRVVTFARIRSDAKDFPALERLASRASSSPPLISLGLKTGDHKLLFLMYLQDRWIAPFRDPAALPKDVTTLYTSTKTPPPPGFTTITDAADVALLARLPGK